MTKAAYKQCFTEEDAVGWIAIDHQLDQLYPDQEPKHFGPIIKYMLGGEDPLDGISIYESKKQQDHLHLISYGFSELYYNEDSAENEYSGWGFELTFRLKPFIGDEAEPHWAMALMQNLAKYVFESKQYFDEFHFIPANGPIRLNTVTEITALAFVLDPELGKVKTANGDVMFLQMVGLTTAEYELLVQNPKTTETEQLIEKLKEKNPLLITDLERK